MRRFIFALRRAAVSLLFTSAAVQAADFAVTPIRVDLAPGARSALVTVTNDDTRPLRMQLRLTEWTQDVDGKDVFTESEDLIYFPKLFSVDPKDKRLVRIGVRSPAGPAERTYRLFLDELPDQNAPAAQSAITFSVRFALPIFLIPAAPSARAEIESLSVERGVVRVKVRNLGNQHFRIESVQVKSGDAFSQEIAGWYLLAGASRMHVVEIPLAVCRDLRRLDVRIKADKVVLERAVDVQPASCQ